MLGKRIATALIGIPFSAYVIHYGQWLFAAVITVLAVLAWREYSLMLKERDIFTGNVLGIAAILTLMSCAWLGNTQEFVFISFVIMALSLMRTVFTLGKVTVNDVAFTIMGIFYIGLSFAHLLLLRFTDACAFIDTPIGLLSLGEGYLWMAFIGTWASDTFAYFVGSAVGKHKLCPAISPGKSVEGAIGGLLGSSGACACFGVMLQLPLMHALCLGVLVGLTAPAGDLVESALKRFAGVKDSGTILPGHGGILDRFDSILFTVPVVYYYIYGFILR